MKKTILLTAALPSATNISYTLARAEQSVTLTFYWTSSVLGCHDVTFNILASNCGSCPPSTKYTNTTCSDVPTDGSMCSFTVQTLVCGNVTGEAIIRLPLQGDRTVRVSEKISFSFDNFYGNSMSFNALRVQLHSEY